MGRIKNVRIAGIAGCVPKKGSMPFYSLSLDPNEIARIKTLIGVSEQRTSSADQCSSDLCAAAADALLDELGWVREDIGFLLFISQTPDYKLPATSPIMQERLGLPTDCVAVDINHGCPAYVYGLMILASLITTGEKKKGLLLVGDTPTKFVSPQDRTAALLFGDAGTATALEADETQGDWHFDMGCDGSRYRAIIIPEGGYRAPASPLSFATEMVEEGVFRNGLQLILNGPEVFNFAVQEPIKSMKNVMASANKDVADIDSFVLHQANLMINEQIRKKMKIPAAKFPSTLNEYGNTSSASIPLTIVSKLGKTLKTQKQSLLLCGFGVGLSWASALLEIDRIACPEVIER